MTYDSDRHVNWMKFMQSDSRYAPSGETDIVMVQYVARGGAPETREAFLESGLARPTTGSFYWKNTVVLQAEKLVRTGVVGSLDELVTRLTEATRQLYKSEKSASVRQISDHIGRRAAGKAAFNVLLEHLKLKEAWKELEPFAVRDLERKGSVA